VEVPLSDVVLTLDNPVAIPREEDTLALTLRFRLDNKSFGPFLVELFPKVLRIGRQDPSLWEEIILSGEVLLHVH